MMDVIPAKAGIQILVAQASCPQTIPKGLNLVHPTRAYPLEKKAFHPLDEIRAETQVRPYHNSLTLALSRGERESGG